MPEPREIRFSPETESALFSILESCPTDIDTLRIVYRRGAHSYDGSLSTNATRLDWAMARVNAFVTLVRTGRPSNSAYTADNDLLPRTHAMYSAKHSITASSKTSTSELLVSIKPQSQYESSEAAILDMVEYSGLGYEVEPAFKASWIRGTKSNTNPFNRVLSMAELGYSSNDADLLPRIQKGTSQ